MSAIDHPAHYQLGGIEVVDVMEAWALPQHGSHALKYLLRAGRKPGSSREQDLRKALWWVERAAGLEVPCKLAVSWWLLRTGPTPNPDAVAKAYGVPVAWLTPNPETVAEAYGVPVEWLVALVEDRPEDLAVMLRREVEQPSSPAELLEQLHAERAQIEDEFQAAAEVRRRRERSVTERIRVATEKAFAERLAEGP